MILSETYTTSNLLAMKIQPMMPVLIWESAGIVQKENRQPFVYSKSKKRKACIPQRAISPPMDHVDRSFQKIISLDVFAAFKQNPAQLLCKKYLLLESESDTSSNTRSPMLEPQVVPEPKKHVGSNTCKILPSFILRNEPQELDLEPYKDTKGALNVSWKVGAQPLPITSDMESFDELTTEEIRTCGTLRISPKQYMEIKRTMLTAVNAYGPFKKREAQTWFRIDICIIYDWFKSLNWIPNNEDWVIPVDVGRRGSVDSHRAKKVRRR